MVLTVRALSKEFSGPEGPVPILRGVDLDLAPGETVALTGESGSGKSTLLHLVAGLEPATSGSIRLAGQEVTALDDRGRAWLRRGTVGVVFQQFNLIPTLTVGANIAFQARLAGRHDPALDRQLADGLGLTPHLAKFPEGLSGGQQQRVAIARALAARPEVILADEPTGNLDEATADAVLTVMLDLCRSGGAALLMVTHSARLAARLDRRLHLTAGRTR
jgi:putative ABC transport system ATP-binding protein